MKLDVNVLRYLTKDEFRVLTAVEMGQKNHEIVPIQLIDSISGLKHGGSLKCIKVLLRHKLLHHDGSAYDGYRLTWMGYDFLAIKAMLNRGHITGIGRQIGVGKESDIYEVTDEEGEVFALKLHRLGRTSFRAVKSKRDYLKGRHNYSWLYLSRLAALKEFAFMRALGQHGFPVPRAIDNSRHAVLMTMVDGQPLVQVRKLDEPGRAYAFCMDLIARLAAKGLVHCDFNEFNLLINLDTEDITVIDFPQMVSVSHANARELFDRDVECVLRFFRKKVGYEPNRDPSLAYIRPSFTKAVAAAAEAAATAAIAKAVAARLAAAGGAPAADGEAASTTGDDAPATDADAVRLLGTLDVELAASGFNSKHQQVLEAFNLAQQEGSGSDEDDGEDWHEQDGEDGGEASGDGGSGSEDEEDIREAGTAGRGAAAEGGAVEDGAAGEAASASSSREALAAGVAAMHCSDGEVAPSVAAAGSAEAGVATASAGKEEEEEDDDSASTASSSDGPSDGERDAAAQEEEETMSWAPGTKKPRSSTQRAVSGRLRPVPQTIGEREAQQLVAAQQRANVKRAAMARAAATRNSSKVNAKGKSRGKGGGPSGVEDSIWG